MNLLLRAGLVGSLTWATIEGLALLGGPCTPDSVSGTYLEARSASVFAGACHVNGETGTQGRNALVAWRVEQGSWGGEDLGGVEVVAAVHGTGSLAESGERSARLWIEARDGAQLRATRAWLEECHGTTLGRVVAVAEGPVEVSLEGEDFLATVEGRAELRGRLEPDRACCTMPEQVWYEPLARVDDAVVGFSEVCRFEGAGEEVPWSHPGQNNAFVGRFRDTPAPPEAREVLPCCAEPAG